MNPEINNVERLLAVRDAVQACGPADAAEWFSEAVDCLMAGGELVVCLGLKLGSGSPAVKRYLEIKRNEYLKAAWCETSVKGPWEKSCRLAEYIDEFREIWPDMKSQLQPDPNWSQLKQNVFRAFQVGVPIPKKRQLHEICSAAKPVSVAQDFLRLKLR